MSGDGETIHLSIIPYLTYRCLFKRGRRRSFYLSQLSQRIKQGFDGRAELSSLGTMLPG